MRAGRLRHDRLPHMTDAECAEVLSEFRKLTLGPELSAALDHAIARLQPRRSDDPRMPPAGFYNA